MGRGPGLRDRTSVRGVNWKLLDRERRNDEDHVPAGDSGPGPEMELPVEIAGARPDVVARIRTRDRVVDARDRDGLEVVGHARLVGHDEPVLARVYLGVHLELMALEEGEGGADRSRSEHTRPRQLPPVERVVDPEDLEHVAGTDRPIAGEADQVDCGAVAVVVHAVVVDVDGVRVDGGVAVVAVVAAGRDGHVAVAVHVVGVGLARVAGVGVGGTDQIAAVAVLVDAVLTDLGGTGVDAPVAIVAVRVVRDVAGRRGAGFSDDGGIAVAIAVGVGVEGELHALVDEAVAVVVHAVADFGGAVLDGRVGVVAVRAVRIAITVAVRIGVFAGEVVAVAVLVDGVVADLGGVRVDGGVDVVAVVAVEDPQAFRRNAATDSCEHGSAVAVAIAVVVDDSGVEATLVDLVVAVVVEVVADFGGAGVDARTRVIAVRTAVGIAIGPIAGDDRVAIDTEAVTVGIGVPGLAAEHAGIGVVNEAVAVVVDIVADFGGAGVDGGVGVVAVEAVVDVAVHAAHQGLRRRIAVGVVIEVEVASEGSFADVGVGVVAVRADLVVALDEHVPGGVDEVAQVGGFENVRAVVHVLRIDVERVDGDDGEGVDVTVEPVDLGVLVRFHGTAGVHVPGDAGAGLTVRADDLADRFASRGLVRVDLAIGVGAVAGGGEDDEKGRESHESRGGTDAHDALLVLEIVPHWWRLGLTQMRPCLTGATDARRTDKRTRKIRSAFFQFS